MQLGKQKHQKASSVNYAITEALNVWSTLLKSIMFKYDRKWLGTLCSEGKNDLMFMYYIK